MPARTRTPEEIARVARFRSALRQAGLTRKDFCKAANIEPSHLYRVLHGDRESASLLAIIESFSTDHLKDGAQAPQGVSSGPPDVPISGAATLVRPVQDAAPRAESA